MAADNTYLLSQGKVYVATREANGAQDGGLIWIGDCDKLEITTSQKFDDIEESYTGQRLVAAHVPIGTTMGFKINALYLSAANIARAYYGTYGGAVTGSTVTGEEVTLYNGARTVFEHPGISAVSVSGAVLGTDYTLDAANGAIDVLSTSTTIPDGTPLVTTVDYTFADYTGKVNTFLNPLGEYRIHVAGFNTANGGAPFLCDIWRGVMDLAKTLSLIEAKHTMLEMSGMLLPDTTRSTTDGQSQWFTVTKA